MTDEQLVIRMVHAMRMCTDFNPDNLARAALAVAAPVLYERAAKVADVEVRDCILTDCTSCDVARRVASSIRDLAAPAPAPATPSGREAPTATYTSTEQGPMVNCVHGRIGGAWCPHCTAPPDPGPAEYMRCAHPGCERLTSTRSSVCGTCRGSGSVMSDDVGAMKPCPACARRP